MVDATAPTAERREEIVGELAEWLHAAAREAQRRLLEAEATDEFVALAGSLSKLARGVRQCVLMHDRLEGQRLKARSAAETERLRAEATAQAEAVRRMKSRVSRAVSRRFDEEWPDREDLDENDAFNERLEDLNERLDDLADAEDFLGADPDALIAKLCEEFGIAPPAPTQSPLIPGPLTPAKAGEAGTQVDSQPAQPLNGSPPSRGRAADRLHAPNTS